MAEFRGSVSGFSRGLEVSLFPWLWSREDSWKIVLCGEVVLFFELLSCGSARCVVSRKDSGVFYNTFEERVGRGE